MCLAVYIHAHKARVRVYAAHHGTRWLACVHCIDVPTHDLREARSAAVLGQRQLKLETLLRSSYDTMKAPSLHYTGSASVKPAKFVVN